ncbi:hypothetical protein Nepgr_013253 [Nepenthes gracilis]|uniref:Uncharacterized protein n=1 Tax=Nepenthes gracilis TaxID=150966 RepID=A0AAD3XNH6_NEPGR|nr:hypothetical protein Nepgr_013253 [Nepenthes gracilis]
MDEVIVRWVLEYLLRQRIDDRILNDLLSVLPIADDSRLKKILLLRRIESEVSNAIVSEEILELLEIIEKLDLCDGKAASESMKAAYCTVAVDCTVRFLEENVEKNGNYFEAVKRIWRIKVSKMEKSENNAVGLVSEKLLRWRDEIEGAIWDSNARDKILMRNTRNEALKAVRLYLAEAWEGMGPSFLELAAQTMSKTGNNGRRAGGEDIVGGCRELVVLDNTAVDGGGGVKGDNHQGLTMNEPAEGDKETQKAKSLLRCKHVASHGRRFKSVAGRSRGVKMTNASKVDKNKSMEQTDLPPTPEISKLQKS